MLQGSKFRIIEVEKLGRRGLVIDVNGGTLLLLDANLTCDERIEILSAMMGLEAA
ncbi:MAG: hypothetical protein ABWY12_11185 [Burkholderiales bacterium]